MRKRRDAKRPLANSEQFRKLVHDALHDATTYLDDGPFDERERPCSERHSFDVRRLLADTDLGEEDARFLLAALRDPGVDPDRAVCLINDCIAVQHLREPFWSQCVQKLASDPDPRVRVLAVRAGV